MQRVKKKNESFCFIYAISIKTECNGGTFGKDCSNQCGFCLNKEQCNYKDGSCLHGCDSGYHGLQCRHGGYIEYEIMW